MKKRFILSALCAVFLPLQAQLGEEALIDSIQERFREQLLLFPQHKIYAQTDKQYYIGGETIWFRAHLTDACFHLPDTISRYVYAELINPQATIVSRVKVKLHRGAYGGHILLPEDLPDGEYQLRFYTRWLENQGEDYFFKRKIFIGNPSSTLTEAEDNSKAKIQSDFHVDFFPEGGHLIGNALNRIAFKALNTAGLGEDITGAVVNSAGDTLVSFQSEHLGMGSFFLMANSQEKLSIICRNSNGKEKTFDLPTTEDKVVGLQLAWRNKHLIIQRNKSSDVLLTEAHYLLIHCRGFIHSLLEWDNSRDFLALEQNSLPSGVIHVLLINKELIPVSERLVFNQNPADAIRYDFLTHQPTYSPRDLIEATLRLYDPDGNPLSGNWSVSVTDDYDLKQDSTVNILTTLLLTSDLRGHIENPASYFNTSDKNASEKLDVLLMTQGWRRYNIANLLQRKYETPNISMELSMYVSGIVKGGFFYNRASTASPVYLFSTDYDLFRETQTVEGGYFFIGGFEVADSTRLFVQGQTKKGKNSVELLANPEHFPEVKNLLPPARINAEELSGFENYLKKADLKYALEHGVRNVLLNEVTVKTKLRNSRSIYYSADNHTINAENIEKMAAPDIFHIIRQLPGVTVSGERISVRGEEHSPLILLDDVQLFDASDVSLLSVEDVESVALLKGGNTALLGEKAANGVIMITTKRGNGFSQKIADYNIKEVSLLGYQKPVAFYSPKYETLARKADAKPDLRTTLYWNPSIETDASGTSRFEFYSADSPSVYSVVIEGVDLEGRIVHVVEKIRIK